MLASILFKRGEREREREREIEIERERGVSNLQEHAHVQRALRHPNESVDTRSIYLT